YRGGVRELSVDQWRPRAIEHAARLEGFLDAHLARRTSRVKHPVHDFLFVYYSHKPGQLRRWHPGFGVTLLDAAQEYGDLKGYEVVEGGVRVSQAHVASQQVLLTTLV